MRVPDSDSLVSRVVMSVSRTRTVCSSPRVGLGGGRPVVEQRPGLGVEPAVGLGLEAVEVAGGARGRASGSIARTARTCWRARAAADLVLDPAVVGAHGLGDLGQVAHPRGRHDGGGGVDEPHVDRRQAVASDARSPPAQARWPPAGRAAPGRGR